MERNESMAEIINLMMQPAFTVKDGIIVLINEAAKQYTLEAGTNISDLLATGSVEYRELTGGCLYLTLTICGIPCGASVNRMSEFDLFTLEEESDQAELQAMALAAQELRAPLSNVMSIADQLFPVVDGTEEPAMRDQISRINRGLFQMLRIVSNMSDAYRYNQQKEQHQAIVEMRSFADEIFAKSAEMLSRANAELRFSNLERPVYTLADKEKLERAIYNILSNAMKFSSKGSCINAHLTCRNNMLYLTVQDNGSGVSQNVRGTVYNRFRRRPGLEDTRFGIGLGMVMIRSAAAVHGGTVLLDQPDGCGTRLTMTMAIRQTVDTQVRSPILRVDYAGEHDHPLLELSDVLPAELYGFDRMN